MIRETQITPLGWIMALRGFTLTEIVVAAVIVATAIAGVLASFIASKRFSVESKTRLMAIDNARYVLELLRKDVRVDTWDTGNLAIGDHGDVTGWLPDEPGTFRNRYSGTANYTVSTVTGSDCRRVDLIMNWVE